jgi:CHAT domain-containing protein/lipoprotein NlpI
MLALNSLGAVYYPQGRYDQAIACYAELRAVAERTGRAEYHGLALLNTSIVRHELGEYRAALSLAKESLTYFQDLPLRHREAHALYVIGNTALQLGRWEEAQAHLQPALALYEQLEMEHGLAEIYWAEGLLHLVLGRLDASLAAYSRCLDLSRSGEQDDPASVMETLPYLGLLHQSEGRVAEALALYEQALALAPLVQNDHAYILVRYRAGTALQQLGRHDEAAAAYADAIDALEQLRSALATDETKLGLLGTTAQIYEAMVLHCLARGQLPEAFQYVERARSRAFLDALGSRTFPDDEAAELRPVGLAQLQAALDDATLLLEFYTTGVTLRDERLVNKLPPSSALRRLLVNEPQTLLFAVSRDAIALHRLALDPNLLQPRAGERSPATRLLSAPLRARLGATLLAPIAPQLHGRATLYLVPHGPLHYVPFAALLLPEGRPLAAPGHPALAYVPSATVLLRARRPSPDRTGTLALGFNDGRRGIALAEAEAAVVAATTGGAAWLGAMPKLAELCHSAPTLRWLHIAGHAEFEPADPLATSIVLGPGERLSGRTIMEELSLDGAEVTLSACTSGLSTVLPGDEQLGLPRAMLFAGAASVLCTLWDAADGVALLIMDQYYRARRRGLLPVAALRDAQVYVRELSAAEVAAAYWRLAAAAGAPELLDRLQPPLGERPFADPFFWAPFLLVGAAHGAG